MSKEHEMSYVVCVEMLTKTYDDSPFNSIRTLALADFVLTLRNLDFDIKICPLQLKILVLPQIC